MKLLFKLLLKATVPLIAVAGVLSYGLYLKGGDPMQMWSKLGDRAMGSIRSMSANSVNAIQTLSPLEEASKNQTVHIWVDADGVTHYGSIPPSGVSTRTLSVRSSYSPPVVTPAAISINNSQPSSPQPIGQPIGQSTGQQQLHQRENVPTSATQSQHSEPSTEENLPGMAGIKLPANLTAEDLGLDTEAIKRLMQP